MGGTVIGGDQCGSYPLLDIVAQDLANFAQRDLGFMMA